MSRMPEHERIAHKLSQVKSSYGQCLPEGKAALHPAPAEDGCARGFPAVGSCCS